MGRIKGRRLTTYRGNCQVCGQAPITCYDLHGRHVCNKKAHQLTQLTRSAKRKLAKTQRGERFVEEEKHQGIASQLLRRMGVGG